MTLQFSIFGYLIMVLFYAISAGLVALVWYPMRSWKGWKYVIPPIAMVILMLPWVDEVYIAWRFHELCKDAGVHVYRKVDVDGYLNEMIKVFPNATYDTTISNPQVIEQFQKQGYRFTEAIVTDGRVSHEEFVDGVLRITILDKPKASYVYKISADNEDMGLQLATKSRGQRT